MTVHRCRSCQTQTVAVSGDTCGICQMRSRNASYTRRVFNLTGLIILVLSVISVMVGFVATYYMLSSSR